MLPASAVTNVHYPNFMDNLYPYPYSYNASMLPSYSSPVSSLYQNSSFSDMPAISETSPPSDPSQKHRSPEEEMKYRMKRDKNNQAAKASRRKRTDREKNLQRANEVLSQQNQALQHRLQEVTQQCQVLQAEVARLTLQGKSFDIPKVENKENMGFNGFN